MAKLSARGRKEIWRVESERDQDDGKRVKTTVVHTDDGALLKKVTWYQRSELTGRPDNFSTGWKVIGKAKPESIGLPKTLERYLGDGFHSVTTKA